MRAPFDGAAPGGSSEGGAPAHPDRVQEVIDAVTGATWGERNRIMEGFFRDQLGAGEGGLPAFSPPGTSLGRNA